MREGRRTEELREFGVERGEDVEEREECLSIIQREGLRYFCFIFRSVSTYYVGVDEGPTYLPCAGW
jgi:hypothetical protein